MMSDCVHPEGGALEGGQVLSAKFSDSSLSLRGVRHHGKFKTQVGQGQIHVY